jgi:hypothetical protein
VSCIIDAVTRRDGETALNVIVDESACSGRDPWFDRPFDRLTVLSKVEGLTVLSKVEGLTTLSKVEGVSSKVLFFSGFRISAFGGFRNDRLGART